MIGMLRAALVIARRDYVASVWSRSFLLFLIGPLLPVLIGTFIGSMGADADRAATRRAVTVIATAADGQALVEARVRLATRLGGQALPDIAVVTPKGPSDPQADAILKGRGGTIAVVSGGIDRPVMHGPARAMDGLRGDIALIHDTARQARAFAAAEIVPPPPVEIAARTVDRVAGQQANARMLTARVGQLVLMMLTMILAGMLLSNLIEEKSNKVIEVLAAAVPVQAIFLGKLIAMLCMSLTGIAVWGGVAGLAYATLLPGGGFAAPAVGWPLFALLGVLYFIACYLLLGALFLGIGAQASSVREVQTLSMPVTMAQLGVVGLASTVVAAPASGLAIAAMIFPWSSPFAMLARAAQSPDLWPHALAIGWQAMWVALIIRVAAAHFRRSVLKSGGGRRWPWSRKVKPSAG